MAEDEAGEKKHEPSDKDWSDAAGRGQLPRSADLGAAFSVLAAAGALYASGDVLSGAISDVLVTSLAPVHGRFDLGDAVSLGHVAMADILRALALPLGAAATAALAVGLAQTQGQLAFESLEPKFDRLNPITGLSNLLGGAQPWVELAKNLGRVGLVGLALAAALAPRIGELPSTAMMPADALPGLLADLGFELAIFAGPAVLAIGVVDYGWSWWKLREQLMKTDQQAKDERKESDGDPHLKAKRRARARELAVSGGLAALADAEVVITNPTHFAVVLRYDRSRDAAPVVVAKGIDAAAMRIRSEARRLRVEQVERRSLARALHARCKVGDAIPEELFVPVARVLAAVWRRRGTRP